ncbi:unnamed protein product [Cuscuta campestris]|uniref:Uncharacterized protein n=1 Tax=Cuscuta campestris TaxID=132261 RepID=A0A484LJJ7_9ASTE|nr:unnamed protein product [Cuscuta campestris]
MELRILPPEFLPREGEDGDGMNDGWMMVVMCEDGGGPNVDLVRGPQILSSLISLELQNFETNMMRVIQNLTSAPLSPPNLALVVTVQNTESHEEELKDDTSVESHVGDVMDRRPKLMNEDDERSNTAKNNEELSLLEGANKVADADNKHADNPFSFDTIKLFDNVVAVKTKYLVSPREPTLAIGSISHVPRFALRSKMIEDSKSGLLLWFSILSPILKHK